MARNIIRNQNCLDPWRSGVKFSTPKEAAASAMLAALETLAKIDKHTNALGSYRTWQAALAAIAQAKAAGIR